MFKERQYQIVVSTLSLVLLAGGLLTACKPSAPTPEPDQVTLQLNWSHEAEFSGYYVAEAQGFYADENIAVTVHKGGIGIDPVQALLERTADLVILEFNEHQRAMGADAQATAVMATFQISPAVLFALSDSGIQRPRDLIGRRVAIKSEGWRRIIHNTLTNAGIDLAEIVEVDVEYDAIELLYNHEVDAWTGYVHDEPTEARLAGHDVNLIFPSDYGVGTYQGLLVVRQDTLDRNSDLVARFVRASLRGWQYAIEHPDEAAEVVGQWQPDYSLEFHQIAVRALVPFLDTGEVPIGWIDAGRWQMGMGTTFDPGRPGYTMQFVQTGQE